MHFSKTYTQLLLDLPPELRENAIEYRQLKKIINSVVNELSALGLKPDILHELIEGSETTTAASSSSSPSSLGKDEPSQATSEPQPHPHSQKPQSQSQSHSPETAQIENENENVDDQDHDHDELKTFRDHPKVVYELNSTSGKIEPQLRIWISMPMDHVRFPLDILRVPRERKRDERSNVEGGSSSVLMDKEWEGKDDVDGGEMEMDGTGTGHASLLWAFQQRHFGAEESGIGRIEEVDGLVENVQNLALSPDADPPNPNGPSASASAQAPLSPLPLPLPPSHSPQPLMREVVIPLVHDTEFYNLLSTKLESISEHLRKMYVDFTKSLTELSRTIADTSHPASMAANFRPLSGITSHAGAVRVKTGDLKSDLYFWRVIFQLYVEAEVFEGIGEASRGERTVEESERRLQLFAERVTKQGLGDLTKFKLRQSREALEQFLGLNLFILNVKKFSFANSEATRKILKKHTKRTALTHPDLSLPTPSPGPHSPSPSPSQSQSASHSYCHSLSQPLLVLVPNSTPFSFPRILVQAIGETLLPIIPSVDDYSCLICTGIAFKPIRLSCGHLFCVRCLVKMQKRRNDHCPMCRSPSVLVANRTNVDWALLNFMQDWFPLESRDKLKANEKEAAEEEMRELGIDPDSKCVVM